MWKVTLPDTGDIDAQLDAALIYVNGDVIHALTQVEREAIHALYGRYDELLGEPDATLIPAGLAACADVLRDAYGEVQKNGRLKDLRERLLGGVMECPLCGSGPATTLDHHLAKDQYRALSINPRNLVPSCQPCNRAKGVLAAVAGEGLIHAYFQPLPAVTFLEADITYENAALTARFCVNGAVLDPGLAARLAFQLNRLELNSRYPDAINILMFNLKPGFCCLRGKPNERDLLHEFLTFIGTSYDEDFGLNHWRAALARGLAGCEPFLLDPWPYFDRPPAGLQAAA